MSDWDNGLPDSDVDSIVKQAEDIMSKDLKLSRETNRKLIISWITSYENKLTKVKQRLETDTINNLRQTALEQMKDVQIKKKYAANANEFEIPAAEHSYQLADEAYHNTKKELQQKIVHMKIIPEISELYTTGYKMIMFIRQKITHEQIEYHVSVENDGEPIIYRATEEHILQNLDFDLNKFITMLITGKGQLDAVMRYRATKSRAEGPGVTKIVLNKESSTLWSLGYRVYAETRKWYLDNAASGLSKGFGVNYGHFLEAYYSLGGNPINRKHSITAQDFLNEMLTGQDKTPFYKGGDYKNIQLKSNYSTLTSLKNIQTTLHSIKKKIQLHNWEAQLKNLFSKNSGTLKKKIKKPKTYETAKKELENEILKLNIH